MSLTALLLMVVPLGSQDAGPVRDSKQERVIREVQAAAVELQTKRVMLLIEHMQQCLELDKPTVDELKAAGRQASKAYGVAVKSEVVRIVRAWKIPNVIVVNGRRIEVGESSETIAPLVVSVSRFYRSVAVGGRSISVAFTPEETGEWKNALTRVPRARVTDFLVNEKRRQVAAAVEVLHAELTYQLRLDDSQQNALRVWLRNHVRPVRAHGATSTANKQLSFLRSLPEKGPDAFTELQQKLWSNFQRASYGPGQW